MEKAKDRRKESFNIMIASGTDARKQPVMFNIHKNKAVILFCAALIFFAGILSASIILLVKNLNNAGEISALEQTLLKQNTLMETYSKNLQNLQQPAEQKP